MARLACLSLLCALAACGSASRPFDDANNGPPDANNGPPDANSDVPDAMPQTAATPSREIVNGAGRVSGATYTFDVEIGQPLGQQPVTGSTYTLEGNAAVKP
jgi:hypothetical protein